MLRTIVYQAARCRPLALLRVSPILPVRFSTSAIAHRIYQSNIPPIDIPNLTVPDYLFSSINESRAKNIAFVDNATKASLTYGELRERSERVAASLQKIGLTKGDVVAIFAANCPEYYVAVFGVALAGGVTTVMNPAYSAREVAFQLKDSNTKYMICGNGPTLAMVEETRKHHPEVDEHIKNVFVFETGHGHATFSSLYENPGKPTPVTINPAKDDFILPYSSGTTGLPKGVCLTHKNVVANIAQIGRSESTQTEKDVFMAVLPMYHIYGLVLNMTGLNTGTKIVTLPKFDLVEYLKAIQTYKATVCHVVPPICVAFAKHPVVSKFDLSSIRIIFSGAAPLSHDTEEQVLKRLKVRPAQGYGMTELSPVSHYSTESRSGSVGRLVANTEARIVDPETKVDLPVGQEGELLIRGPQVMRCYLNRPDATASTINNDGFLLTGDIARVDPDGYFYIVDRVKELIKYKGCQVPPAELEGVLLSHPNIADCAVIGIPDETAGELPLAFVVLKPDHRMTEDEVKRFVADNVSPTKQLRGGVRFTDAIPKSAAGKILRRLLRDTIQKEKQPSA